MTTAPDTPLQPHDPYAALRVRDFRLYLPGVFLGWLGMQMQTVAIGWEIYQRTKSPVMLGAIGLAYIIPALTLALPAGHFADRVDRRRILITTESALVLVSLALAAVSFLGAHVALIFVCLVLIGIVRAIQGPASSSFLPQIVPRHIFSNAVSWNGSAFHTASIAGPLLGGLLLYLTGRPGVIYVTGALLMLIYLLCLTRLRPRPFVPNRETVTFRSLLAGLRFVYANRIMFGSITLDMFAVLLGGAVALLPIFASDILRVGPTGLGVLVAAPSVGAILMSLLIAHLPPMQKAGKALLWSVVGFGVATIVFGLSRSFWLSLIMLAFTGVFDQISVVIRHTMVQTLTPDAMRGRVSAVNGVFISTSNELGWFESGFVAWLFLRPGDPAFGPTVSVVIGGVGSILVVIAVALIWPQLRRFGRLDTTGDEAWACANCGFDLRAIEGRNDCPECGHGFDITPDGNRVTHPKANATA